MFYKFINNFRNYRKKYAVCSKFVKLAEINKHMVLFIIFIYTYDEYHA